MSKPLTYFRYVDDTFTIFHYEEELKDFFNQQNCLYPSLKITFKKEKNNTRQQIFVYLIFLVFSDVF